MNNSINRYAMTFRLTVIRSAWVYAAWEQRDKSEFKAKAKTFTDEHRLKAFEGQRICFFGFAPEEHEHMIDVLKLNGGITATLEDPECTHVVSYFINCCGFFFFFLNYQAEQGVSFES